MHIKRKYIGILLLIAVLITGCSGDYISSLYDSDIKISSSTNSYNLTGAIQTIEDGKFIGQVKKFEGMDTIWTYEAAEDGTLEVTYLLNAKKGKVKLVLISPDGLLTDVIERSDHATFTDYATSIMQIKKGTNRLKLVGSKDCSVEIELIIDCGKFKELGM